MVNAGGKPTLRKEKRSVTLTNEQTTVAENSNFAPFMCRTFGHGRKIDNFVTRQRFPSYLTSYNAERFHHSRELQSFEVFNITFFAIK